MQASQQQQRERAEEQLEVDFQRVLVAEIQGSAAEIALWRIFRQAVITHDTLEGLAARIASEHQQVSAESDFVQAVQNLRSHGVPWGYILGLHSRAKPELQDIFYEWVQVAKHIIEVSTLLQQRTGEQAPQQQFERLRTQSTGERRCD